MGLDSVEKRRQSYLDAKVFKSEILEIGSQMGYEMEMDLRAMKYAIAIINEHIERKPANNRLLETAINKLEGRLKHELPRI